MKRFAVFFIQLMIALAIIIPAALWLKFTQSNEELMFDDDAAYLRWVGKPAHLEFVAVDGRAVNLEKLHGKVVLLDFWATWCGPCLQGLPHVKAAYDKFHDRGFEIVGISFDEDKAALETVVREQQIPWPQYFDAAGSDHDVGQAFDITHYPSLWLVDQEGIIRYISAGQNLEKKITSLLDRQEEKPASNSPWLNKMMTAVGSTVKQVQNRKKTQTTANTGTADEPPDETPNSPGATSSKGLAPSPTRPGSKLLAQLALKGISVSGTNATAIVAVSGSHHTLKLSEELAIRTEEGPVVIRCEEIGRSSVIVAIPNTTVKRELRLR